MSKTKVLFFDTETTGLPPKNANWRTDYRMFPFIVSLGWEIDGVEKHRIIQPDSYTIPDESIAIHGITHQQALEQGVPFSEVLLEFIEDLKEAIVVVGHSIYFDSSIVKANCMRYFGEDFYARNLDSLLDVKRRIDTMKKTIKFVGAKYPDGRAGKFPKLTELYEKLFPGEEFEAHNALADSIATKRCFWKLIELGVIERPTGIQSELSFSEPESVISVEGNEEISVSPFEAEIASVMDIEDTSGGLQRPGGFLKNYKRANNEEG